MLIAELGLLFSILDGSQFKKEMVDFQVLKILVLNKIRGLMFQRVGN